MGCQVFLHERNCPYATKSLRLKATQSINISNLVKLSDFVTLWQNIFFLYCYLVLIIFGSLLREKVLL